MLTSDMKKHIADSYGWDELFEALIELEDLSIYDLIDAFEYEIEYYWDEIKKLEEETEVEGN